jgi:hypothetical protein
VSVISTQITQLQKCQQIQKVETSANDSADDSTDVPADISVDLSTHVNGAEDCCEDPE